MKSRWVKALRWLSTLALGALVAYSIDGEALRRALVSIDEAALVQALGFTLLTPLLGAYRFRRALARLDQHPPFAALLADLLVASAYNLVLPTSMGGDVVRAARCRTRVEQPSLGYACILYERALGLFLLAAAGAGGALSVIRIGDSTLLAVAVLFGVATWFLFRRLGTLLSLFAGVFSAWPRFSAALGSTGGAMTGPLSSGRAALDVGFWSLAYQLSNLSILAVVAASFGEARWASAVYLGVPLALVISALPITIGGFGLRESLFVTVLGAYGFSSEHALLLALLWVASSAVLALLGIAVLLHERLFPKGVNAERAIVADG